MRHYTVDSGHSVITNLFSAEMFFMPSSEISREEFHTDYKVSPLPQSIY